MDWSDSSPGNSPTTSGPSIRVGPQDSPVVWLVTNTIYALSLPFQAFYTARDAAVDPRVQRLAISTAAFVFVAWALLLVSAGEYVAFYWWYMPAKTFWKLPIWMQYGSVSPHAPSAFMIPTNPHAIIPLVDDKYRLPFLLPHQQYHIAVQLRVPDSDHNERLGNFMCEAELKRELVGKNGVRETGEVIARESRPGILPYRSPALRLASALTRAGPVILFDAFREERDIQIVLWEEWASGRADALPTNLHLTVSHPLGSPSSHLHTISTHLLVSLRFQGLRHYMHNWPLLTALVVTAVFATWNAAIVAAVWWGIKGGVSMEEGGEKEQFGEIPLPPRGKQRIEEDEESEDEAEPVSGARSKGKGPARVPQDEDDEEEDEFDSPEDHIVPSAIPAIAVVHRDTVPEVAIKAEVEIKQEPGLEGDGEPEDESNGSYDVIGRDEGQPDVGEGGVRRRVTAGVPE